MTFGTPLTPQDFPLTWIGPNIYRRTESSPLCTVANEHVAADLVFRLNEHEARKVGGHSGDHRPEPIFIRGCP